MKPICEVRLNRRRSWPSAPTPTTSSSAAAASSPGRRGAGGTAHFVVCSRGESATHGTPAERTAEAKKAAALLGATLEFIELDGDASLEVKAAHAIRLAAIIRRVRPGVVLAPSLVENQHPDHSRLGRLVRDAARLARYGGVKKLQGQRRRTPSARCSSMWSPRRPSPRASCPSSWTSPRRR